MTIERREAGHRTVVLTGLVDAVRYDAQLDA